MAAEREGGKELVQSHQGRVEIRKFCVRRYSVKKALNNVNCLKEEGEKKIKSGKL